MYKYSFLNRFSNLVYNSKDKKRAIAFGNIRFLEKYKSSNPTLSYSQIIKSIYDEQTCDSFYSIMHVALKPGLTLFLKFEFLDKLYLMDKRLSIENQKKILVKRIGNINFVNDININDIGNTKIIFEDFYPNTNNKTFEGEISFSDLLKQLSNKKYLDSIYFDNSYFNKI